MKKILSVCGVLFILFISFAAFAEPVEYTTDKIEQIYSRMPEIKAYMRLKEPIDDKAVTGFINSDKLTLVSHSPFNREDGVSFIFMFDCSTSVSSYQMNSMKNAVINYINNDSYENDRFTVVSFGEKIDILANGTGKAEEAVAALKSMKNNQNATILYDAANAVKQLSDEAGPEMPKKRMCIIFTDAVNYNVGGTTDTEVLKTAEIAGTPIYAVAINPYNKDSIDSLGAIARVSGGDVCVSEGGNIEAAFKKAVKNLDDLYEISFAAETNKAALGECNLSVGIGAKNEGGLIEHKFYSLAWSADSDAPMIVSTEVVDDKELHIKFSEAVENAGKAENYTVKKGPETLAIKDVRYDEKNYSAIISFNEYLGSGKYEIATLNITDSSMEKNSLSDTYTFDVSGFSAFIANFKNSSSGGGGWLIAFFGIIIATIIICFVIKKQKNQSSDKKENSEQPQGDNIRVGINPGKLLPSGYMKLTMETADGNITDLDINIVQSIIFGRSESCEFTIDDSNLSRQHFAIELENGMLFIQNLSQTNGTLLNGIPLLSKRKLEIGDVINAGQEKFTVIKIQ